ncbi:hypothetical protein ACGFIF_33900 [Kribbella sp. NPDC049174]|uniref:hypothetical protein n=1 Tax=Kribbella sp. NPDC049174 TaxID=3364112 RepID=UPI00371966AF
MAFRFRLRFHLPARCRLGIEVPEIALTDPEENFSVVLKSPGDKRAIAESDELLLVGASWQSADAASHAATLWRGYLQVALARIGVAADFGDRAPGGGRISVDGSRIFTESTGVRYFEDVHGILVYDDVEKAVFGRANSLQLQVVKPKQWLQAAVSEARARAVTQGPAEQLAYDLYSGSFFQPSADARFMMLMMAFETLAEQNPRPKEIGDLVDGLIQSLGEADLTESDKQSLKGGLRDLKRESVGQAGRRLAKTLGDRTYIEMSPTEFFNRCYKVRSNLVHGAVPRPSRDEVDNLAATLELFVGDLIAVQLLANTTIESSHLEAGHSDPAGR